MKTSKYKGVFKVNEHGHEYWVAQHIFNKQVRRKRTIDEEVAARKYDQMRMEHGLSAVNF